MPSDQFRSVPPVPSAEHPRSTVRVLLGLPVDKEGNRPTTGKLTLPAGLRYGQSPLPEWDNTESRQERREEQDNWDEWPGEEIDNQGSAALDQPVRPISQRQTSRAGALFSSVTSQSTPASASQPPDHLPTPTAPARLERTHLEMPGVSTRRQDFPALSQPDTTGTTSPDGADRTEASGLERYGRPAPSASSALGPKTLDADLLDRLERLVADTEADHSAEVGTTSVSDRTAPRHGSATDGPQVGRRSSASHSPVEQTNVQRLDRANQALAAQLEQLRRMVGELAKKSAPQPAQQPAPPQPRERPASQPAQRTVIVKHPPPLSRTPRAFWERRYLSRASLRSMR